MELRVVVNTPSNCCPPPPYDTRTRGLQVKQAAEAKFEGTWHCIVGQNFGCSVCFAAKHLLFARISASKAKDVALRTELNCLVFKSAE
jgi:hypothetical protein